jgi:hypothetical protein
MHVPGVCTRTAVGALALWVLLPGAVQAIGVDGSGQRVIVPLVFSNQGFQSLVTLSNPGPGPEPVKVSGQFIGAEGTVYPASQKGALACEIGEIRPRESITRRLRDMCPGLPHDGEVLGYLSLIGTAMDSRPSFFATSVVSTLYGAQYGVTGQPIGAFDPGFASPPFGLHVAGLRTISSRSQVLTCYVATLNEEKKVAVLLRDEKGAPVGGPITLQLDAERMHVVDVEAEAGLPPDDRDGLSVVFESSEGSVVVAGCGPKLQSNGARAYQAAQTAVPADRARLRSVAVEFFLQPGPFSMNYSWSHTQAGDPQDVKVTLSSYFRPSDEVRCALAPWWAGGTDFSQYLEIRIVDPKGTVIGGGSGVRDTGVVTTRPQGAYASHLSQRHLIEISYDEDTAWPISGFNPGGWAIACQSGAGMSEPVPVSVLYGDDF